MKAGEGDAGEFSSGIAPEHDVDLDQEHSYWLC